MLYTQYVKTQDLRIFEILRMHSIFESYYDHSPIDTFIRDLSKKDGAFLVRRKKDHGIVGFSTLGIYHFEHEGERVKGLFSGDTIIEKAYWGSRVLQMAFARKLALEAFKNPFTKQYWLLISKGYKTYLLMARNFPVYYPDHRQEHPGFKHLVMSYCDLLYPGRLLADKMVLDFGKQANCLKGNVADITAEMRQADPAIDFFAQHNPGWVHGHELPCIAQADLRTFMRLVWPFLGKALLPGKRAAQKALAPGHIQP